MYYIYFIKSILQNKVYVGYTGNLTKRMEQHNSRQGGKYTRQLAPFKLIYYEAYRSKADALRREHNLKLHKKAYGQLKSRISESLEFK